MTDSQLNSEAEKIYNTSSSYFGGLSPKADLRSGLYSIYCGITKLDLKSESFRFLTRRGTLTDFILANIPIQA